jgi:hypothetical protein
LKCENDQILGTDGCVFELSGELWLEIYKGPLLSPEFFPICTEADQDAAVEKIGEIESDWGC